MIEPERRSFLLTEWPHLAKLVRQYTNGRVQFYTTFVLYNEAFPTLTLGSHHAFPTSFFHFCEEGWIEDPFNFLTLGAMESQPAKNFDLAIKFAMRRGIEDIQRSHRYVSTECVEILLSTLRNSPPKHYRDIYNIYLAHVNNVNYFLTFDKKIIRYFSDTIKNPFRCEPVLPSSLGPLLEEDKKYEFAIPQSEFLILPEMMNYWRSIGLTPARRTAQALTANTITES